MADVVPALLKLSLAFLLVGLNGMFVAAEFAFVRIRAAQVDALVERGGRSAKIVQEAVQNLDDYLAVSQLGITLSSLGLGWIGEPAVAALIDPILGTFLAAETVHLVSIALGFGFITFLHVVFGELAPKTFSIQDAEKVSLAVAVPMKFCYYVFMPGIIVFNGTANAFTSLLGYPPASETEETHSEEEIQAILSHSEQHGHLDLTELEMIEGIFRLDDMVAREVMVPRPDVVFFAPDLPLEELLTVAAEENYTSYPVLDIGGEEPVVGSVHVEDVLRTLESAGAEKRTFTAGDLARDVLVVPEDRRINDILTEFQERGTQMAVVIDEWGAFEGIVTIEDILEEIVGEIQDEFDTPEQEPSIDERDDGVYAVDGEITLPQMNEALDTGFENEEFETVGGLVLSHLGHAPETGDRVELDGYALSVEEVQGNRITRVTVQEIERGGRESTAESSE